MSPDEARSYVAVQGAPSAMEIQAQDAVEVGMDWTGISIAVVTALGGGAVGHWFASRAAMKKAITDHTQLALNTYERQLDGFSMRLGRVEKRLRRAEHVSDRYRRIAYLALDRVDDQSSYLGQRDEIRRHHDPDGTMTPWVPQPPMHLTDTEWTARRRAELNTLDDLLDDDGDSDE